MYKRYLITVNSYVSGIRRHFFFWEKNIKDHLWATIKYNLVFSSIDQAKEYANELKTWHENHSVERFQKNKKVFVNLLDDFAYSIYVLKKIDYLEHIVNIEEVYSYDCEPVERCLKELTVEQFKNQFGCEILNRS